MSPRRSWILVRLAAKYLVPKRRQEIGLETDREEGGQAYFFLELWVSSCQFVIYVTREVFETTCG